MKNRIAVHAFALMAQPEPQRRTGKHGETQASGPAAHCDKEDEIKRSSSAPPGGGLAVTPGLPRR
jgi:hypothetical protein